MFQVLVNFNDN